MRNAMDLQGKTIVITGGSAGVGLEVARQLVARRSNVVITGRDGARLQRAADELGAGDRVMTASVDAGDLAAGRTMLADAEARFGAIHGLVNNAAFNARGPVLEREAEELGKIVDTNLRAPILLCHAAIPMIVRAGGGAIVNVASLAGRVPLPDEATYSATKFGLRAFSLALADELADRGVTVSVICPGPIETSFIMDDLDEMPPLVFSQPMSQPEEIAADVVACLEDGRPERVRPRASGALTTVASVLPGLARMLKPVLEWRGASVKESYRRKYGRT